MASGTNKSRPKTGNGTKESRPAPKGSPTGSGVRNRSRDLSNVGAVQPDASRTLRFFNRFGRWIAIAAVLACGLFLVSPDPFPEAPSLESNEILNEDIRAKVSFSVVDESVLSEEIQEEKARFPHYYQYNPEALSLAKSQIRSLIAEGENIRVRNKEIPAQKWADILANYAESEHRVRFDAGDLSELYAKMDDPSEFRETIESVFEYAYADRGIVRDLNLYKEHYQNGRVESLNFSRTPQELIDLSNLGQELNQEFGPGGDLEYLASPRDRSLIVKLLKAYARPNIVHRPNLTDENREKAIRKLRNNPPERAIVHYEKGDVVLEEGANLQQEQLALLSRMQDAYRKTALVRLGASLAYLFILCSMVMVYFRAFKDMPFTTSNVFLISLPILMALGLGRIAMEIARNTDAAGYLFPAGIIGMITVILLDARSAILLVTVGALAFAVQTGLDFRIFLVSLLGGYSAVSVLTTAKERKEVLRASVVVGIVNAVTALVITLIDNPSVFREDFVLYALGGGLVCGVIAMPALVIFESMFSVVTDIRLLELTGLDHPLLKDLEEKAPGSYQHSLNVCKLAEAAARAIGANYLLVRAGAYYHDVGKTLKPTYFGENQVSLSEKSLHSKVSPYMSAMIIKNHVKMGIELARKHKLPDRVIDFIPQHHGTTVISFFYHEALKRFENSQSTDPVRESDFRYPGPRPQFIETAIVMLADTVEATVTSRFTSTSINEHELSLCVRKSVTDKFNDGQFDECDLTLRDLYLIQQSFVKTLLGRFHQRVAYPTRPGLSGPTAAVSKHDRLEREKTELARAR